MSTIPSMISRREVSFFGCILDLPGLKEVPSSFCYRYFLIFLLFLRTDKEGLTHWVFEFTRIHESLNIKDYFTS